MSVRQHHPTRKRADFPLVFHHERTWPTDQGDKADDSRCDSWCGSHAAVDWHAIDWLKAHRHVRRLQARIVKAVQAGRWGKVKALQHLLTHSFSAKALAVKRVTENPGKRTPGVDGILWDTPEKKAGSDRPVAPVWLPSATVCGGYGFRNTMGKVAAH